VYAHRVLGVHVGILGGLVLLLLSVGRSNSFPRLTPSCRLSRDDVRAMSVADMKFSVLGYVLSYLGMC
jgi:hypothetical protein